DACPIYLTKGCGKIHRTGSVAYHLYVDNITAWVDDDSFLPDECNVRIGNLLNDLSVRQKPGPLPNTVSYKRVNRRFSHDPINGKMFPNRFMQICINKITHIHTWRHLIVSKDPMNEIR